MVQAKLRLYTYMETTNATIMMLSISRELADACNNKIYHMAVL